jgi:hypothetical protein
MPVPKPLSKKSPKSKKKARMTQVMHDLRHGPHHKDRTREQEIAIGMKSSGQSNKPESKKSDAPRKQAPDAKDLHRIQKKSTKDASRRKRNIGRS